MHKQDIVDSSIFYNTNNTNKLKQKQYEKDTQSVDTQESTYRRP